MSHVHITVTYTNLMRKAGVQAPGGMADIDQWLALIRAKLEYGTSCV